MKFSRQEHWSGKPLPTLEDLPDPGVEPMSPALAGGFFTTSATWEFPVFAVLFSCSVMSNSLLPHGLQPARLPCPLLSPGVCSISCPLSRWCHQTISSSVNPVSSCPLSFPELGSFPVIRLFTSGSQTIAAQFQHQKWSEVKVIQSCLTLCNSMDYTVQRILQPEYWSG